MQFPRTLKKFLCTAAIVATCSACVSQSLPPLIQDVAFEPITPLMPVTQVSVTGSIFNDSNASTRFGYKKNYQVGDIITVVLTESTQAQRQSGVETSREGSNGPLAAIQAAFGLSPTFSSDSSITKRALKATPFDGMNIESKGSGTANQAASLDGAVAATVVQVLPNNSVVIQGQKRLTLSEGSETIRIIGVVSLNDIQPDNTVLSSRLANAQISYQGAGNLASVAKVPWGTNALNKVWPF
ncbi:MAG: flagellar basal body L-ring protein FlgH [Pseudomonadales bacterium]|jgi:flagellar L-ring protein precursor FlgH